MQDCRTTRHHDQNPVCRGRPGEEKERNCLDRPGALAQDDTTGNIIKICDGTNAPCIEPSQMKSPLSRPNAQPDAQKQGLVQGDDTGKPIRICNGFNTGNCIEADQVKDQPVGQALNQDAEKDKTGLPVIICDGITNTSNCIEPNDMKDPKGRPNAKSMSQGEDTGKPYPICNGFNSTNCIEPEQVKDQPRRQAFAEGDDTGKIINTCNGANSHDCIEPESVQNKKAVRQPNKLAQGDGTGEAVRICDGVTNTNDCIEPNMMRHPKSRPNARSLTQALPICNGENGRPGVDCRQQGLNQGEDTGKTIQICNGFNTGNCVEASEMERKAEALVAYYLPTCTDRQQEDCQPVCTESLTIGCTEARTPNWPSRDRFEGKYTHK